jgi:hypothetical protein
VLRFSYREALLLSSSSRLSYQSCKRMDCAFSWLFSFFPNRTLCAVSCGKVGGHGATGRTLAAPLALVTLPSHSLPVYPQFALIYQRLLALTACPFGFALAWSLGRSQGGTSAAAVLCAHRALFALSLFLGIQHYVWEKNDACFWKMRPNPHTR